MACICIHNTATSPKIFCPDFQTLAVLAAKLKPRIVSSVSTGQGSSRRTQYAVTYSDSCCGRYRGTCICRRFSTRLSYRHWDGALRLTLSPLIESAVQVHEREWISYSGITLTFFFVWLNFYTTFRQSILHCSSWDDLSYWCHINNHSWLTLLI